MSRHKVYQHGCNKKRIHKKYLLHKMLAVAQKYHRKSLFLHKGAVSGLNAEDMEISSDFSKKNKKI